MRKAIRVAACVLAPVGLTVLMGCSSAASTDDLLLALLWRDGGAPVIYPGDLPEGLEIDLPEASRLVGSAEWRDRSQIIVELDSGPEEALAALTESLVSQGWELDPGRIHRYHDPRTVVSASLCRDDREGLILTLEPDGSGATLGTLMYPKTLGRGPCTALRNSPFRTTDLEVFPLLVGPEGATKWSGKGGGGGEWTKPGDSHYQAGVLETSLSVSELLEHYAEQMKQAGWVLTDQLIGEGASVQLWARSGEGGEEFFGSFVVVELADATFEVNLRVIMTRAGEPA